MRLYLLHTLTLFTSLQAMESKNWPMLLEEHKDLIADVPVVIKQYNAYVHDNVPSPSDLRIAHIRIKDCGEDLVDLLDFANSRFCMMPDPSYPAEGPQFNSGLPGNSRMRTSVAMLLNHMVENLDNIAPRFGYEPGQVDIQVCDAFRNKQIQEFIFNIRHKQIAKNHPDWLPDKIYTESSKLVAPSKKPFIHPSGAAVDIRLWNSAKKEFLDMGDFGVPWMKDPSTLATFAENITEQQKRNRLFCIIAAAQTGLVNYPAEFWHFSHGDSMATYWTGGICGRYKAIYDLVEQEKLDISIDANGHFKVVVLSSVEQQ